MGHLFLNCLRLSACEGTFSKQAAAQQCCHRCGKATLCTCCSLTVLHRDKYTLLWPLRHEGSCEAYYDLKFRQLCEASGTDMCMTRRQTAGGGLACPGRL